MATFVEFISVLHQSHTQAKTWHNRTDSLGEDLALGSYYNDILEIVDGLVESYQGIKGRIDGYDTKELIDWKSGLSTEYFKQLYAYVQSERDGVGSESWIQNQIDEVSELIAETLYKLSLK